MPDPERRRTEAGEHILRLAADMLPVLGDVDTAGTLIGAGATVLLRTRGIEFTADCLRMLADEIDQAGDDPMAGNG